MATHTCRNTQLLIFVSLWGPFTISIPSLRPNLQLYLYNLNPYHNLIVNSTPNSKNSSSKNDFTSKTRLHWRSKSDWFPQRWNYRDTQTHIESDLIAFFSINIQCQGLHKKHIVQYMLADWRPCQTYPQPSIHDWLNYTHFTVWILDGLT